LKLRDDLPRPLGLIRRNHQTPSDAAFAEKSGIHEICRAQEARSHEVRLDPLVAQDFRDHLAEWPQRYVENDDLFVHFSPDKADCTIDSTKEIYEKTAILQDHGEYDIAEQLKWPVPLRGVGPTSRIRLVGTAGRIEILGFRKNRCPARRSYRPARRYWMVREFWPACSADAANG